MPAPIQFKNSATLPATGGSERESRLWFLAAGLIALGALLFVRNPSVVLHPQFWHEDAIIFLAQQRAEGWAALLQPYAGYSHLFPRIVAASAAFLPLEFTPLLYLCGAYAGWLWVGALLLTSPVFASTRWAFFAVLAWVAVPHGGEVFLNLTNVQWALATGLALVLAEGPTRRGPMTRWIFVGLAALTGPFALVLAPLAGWRLWATKRDSATVDQMALITMAGAAIQLILVLKSSGRFAQASAVDPSWICLQLGLVGFPELFGTKDVFPGDLFLRLTGTVAGVAGAAWVGWKGIGDAPNRRRLLLGAGLMLAAGFVAAQDREPQTFGPGQRYLFVPFALYVSALIAAWSHSLKHERTRVLGFMLLAAIGFHSSSHFMAGDYPAADWRETCRLLRSGQAVEIRVAPLGTWVKILPERAPGAPQAATP